MRKLFVFALVLAICMEAFVLTVGAVGSWVELGSAPAQNCGLGYMAQSSNGSVVGLVGRDCRVHWFQAQ